MSGDPITFYPQSKKMPLSRSRQPLRICQWLFEERGWKILLPAADFAAISITVALVFENYPTASSESCLLFLPFISVFLFYLRKHYRPKIRSLFLDSIMPMISAVSVALMGVSTIGFFITGQAPGQNIWLATWVLSILLTGAFRSILMLAQWLARTKGFVGQKVLIMGAGVIGSQLARRLQDHPEYGLLPVGFLDEHPLAISETGARDIDVLGTANDLAAVVKQTQAKQLIVAFSLTSDQEINKVINSSQSLGLKVSIVPRLFDTMNQRVGYEAVGGLPLLSFNMIDPKGLQFQIKHVLDVVIAALLLVLLSPLLLLISALLIFSSNGKILFSQERVGRDGKVFKLYKFRSMRATKKKEALAFSADKYKAPGGIEGEDRRTALGKILRRCSLDELPQLVNVLKGEMSLVGPRPERIEFVGQFTSHIDRYEERHRVKSGITGWAQVHVLRGQTSLADRVEWDNYYIAHWSLGLDLKILVMTFTSLLHSVE
jgi:exopolysaccharide biosynthesis polyprenyl glycosylphosphotransferase